MVKKEVIHSSEDELRKSEIRYRRLFEAAQDGILILDAYNGQIVDVNPFLLKMLGYSYDELLGKELWEIGVFNNIADSKKAFLELQDKGYIRFEDMPLEKKDGKSINVEFVSNSYLVENLKVIQCNIRDISIRVKAESELVKAKEMAEEGNRLKLALLRNLSHEIRTPLNAIMGFSRFIPNAKKDKLKKYSDIILQCSNDLLKLTDDVILLSRLQSEKMSISRVNFMPSELILSICHLFQKRDYGCEIEIKHSFPGQNKNIRIRSDEKKIGQILTYFITNAIKYTPQGSVEIGFDIRENKIVFYVKDTGIGIPVVERKSIFEAFFRGEQAIFNAIRGNGLGLSISIELVKLLGGEIKLESEENIGSCFYFSIPHEKYEIEEKIA